MRALLREGRLAFCKNVTLFGKVASAGAFRVLLARSFYRALRYAANVRYRLSADYSLFFFSFFLFFFFPSSSRSRRVTGSIAALGRYVMEISANVTRKDNNNK